jgi:FkbM family methyltransferase
MNLAELEIKLKQQPLIKGLLYPVKAVKQLLREPRRKVQREFFHNLGNLLAEDPVINVSEFQGQFVVDCRSELFKRLVTKNKYEPELANYCLKYLDRHRDAIDVGANIGFFTVLMAKNLDSGKVLAIEPTPNALARLERNIELNSVGDRTIVFAGVASNVVGEIEIKIVEGNEEFATLGAMNHPSVSDRQYIIQKVKAITIDELVKQHLLNPGFLKVDVEGLEPLIFDGARDVLDKHRPIIISELSSYLLKQNGFSSSDVIDLIKKYNYDIVDPINPDIPPGDRDFGDILCLPK